MRRPSDIWMIRSIVMLGVCAQPLWVLGQTPAEPGGAERAESSAMRDMVFVKGGTFQMGDVFGERVRLASPVHKVTVSAFHLNRYEVTVGEFRSFVAATGYRTSAERDQKVGAVLLARTGESWASDANWRNPHFEQTPEDPVVCVSWLDAISYCNWLSDNEGLPHAYDVETGDLLDEHGKVTTEVTKVKGYRLPTEAEWEYAARQRGKKMRFGNGKNVARSSEINYDAANGACAYSEAGESRCKTVPVGSFKPNSLGLYDMSGNVWEWCSDYLGKYGRDKQTNPYQTQGAMGSRRAARGGPWVGGASWARVSARIGWESWERCNNCGFRVARSN